MKNIILNSAISFFIITVSFAQGVDGVLIDPNNATTRDASAVFQAQSTTQGMLAPRITAAQKTAITLPAAGLLIYQTDGTPGFYYNSGTPGVPVWVLVANSSGNNDETDELKTLRKTAFLFNKAKNELKKQAEEETKKRDLALGSATGYVYLTLLAGQTNTISNA